MTENVDLFPASVDSFPEKVDTSGGPVENTDRLDKAHGSALRGCSRDVYSVSDVWRYMPIFTTVSATFTACNLFFGAHGESSVEGKGEGRVGQRCPQDTPAPIS